MFRTYGLSTAAGERGQHLAMRRHEQPTCPAEAAKDPAVTSPEFSRFATLFPGLIRA
jgi:hypothetical protein